MFRYHNCTVVDTLTHMACRHVCRRMQHNKSHTTLHNKPQQISHLLVCICTVYVLVCVCMYAFVCVWLSLYPCTSLYIDTTTFYNITCELTCTKICIIRLSTNLIMIQRERNCTSVHNSRYWEFVHKHAQNISAHRHTNRSRILVHWLQRIDEPKRTHK